LEAPENRIIPEKCVWPVTVDEFSLRRSWREVVNEDRTRFPSSQEIERKPKGPEILRAVDQNGVTPLQSFWQDFARIAVEQFNIRARA
jgi:hypothetical protein